MYKVKAITNGVCTRQQALKEARDHLDWSQAKLADYIGVRRETVICWENKACPLQALLAVQGVIAIEGMKASGSTLNNKTGVKL